MTVLEMMPTGMDLDIVVDHRQDLAGGTAAAVFDESRTYRYLLTRIWDPARAPMVWVMLNPSTADAFVEDATVRRLAGGNGFARREGAGGIVVVNLFAVRSTDPRVLLRHEDPVGRYNDVFIRQATSMSSTVVCAWGAAGVQHGRGQQVTEALTARRVALSCLGTTSTGQPRHPLYVPGDAVLQPYGGVS
ncbi:DUF1643 domain-containing protein [Streptomyces sp. NPDC008092]|uniref:DUF1643 domain-containing protein n=1 Tax=Streptomyces sp. NPDC008092 TaxID=3364808 RepID=UPI0036ECE154